MNTINHADLNSPYDEQIEQIENKIRALQSTMPVDDIQPMSAELTTLLDTLFSQLHTIIALKCVMTIEPENTLMMDAIKNQQPLKLLNVAKLAQQMTTQIEGLHDVLSQENGDDVRLIGQIKQTIAEFFIARQVLVDTVISTSSEADGFCDCIACQQSTYHQFTAAFDYVCTQCETPFFLMRRACK